MNYGTCIAERPIWLAERRWRTEEEEQAKLSVEQGQRQIRGYVERTGAGEGYCMFQRLMSLFILFVHPEIRIFMQKICLKKCRTGCNTML